MLNPVQLDHLRVVLVASRNPLNIGAAARAMSNFGFLRLRVVNPYNIAFREAQSAVGAASLLANAEEFQSIAEAIADCALVVGTTAGRDRQQQHPLRTVQEAAPLIRTQLAAAPVALLFGSEKRGLSNEDLSYCQWLMHVPTRDEHVSMNLGQAVAVCLYELVREGNAESGLSIPQLATSGELDRIAAVLLEALNASGYVNPKSAASTEEKARRMIRRLNLTAADAETLLGMLRQIMWKLEHD
jgi:TrmH family RNA methyltransferase